MFRDGSLREQHFPVHSPRINRGPPGAASQLAPFLCRSIQRSPDIQGFRSAAGPLPGSKHVQTLLYVWQIAGSHDTDSPKHPVLGFHIYFPPVPQQKVHSFGSPKPHMTSKQRQASQALLVKLPSTRRHHPLSEPRQIRRIFLLGSLPIARARHAIQAHVAAVGKQTLIVNVWPLCQASLSYVFFTKVRRNGSRYMV